MAYHFLNKSKYIMLFGSSKHMQNYTEVLHAPEVKEWPMYQCDSVGMIQLGPSSFSAGKKERRGSPQTTKKESAGDHGTIMDKSHV